MSDTVDFLNVCSFCGHSRDDIEGLVVGPHVSICFNCVETAKSVVKHEKHGPDSNACTCGYRTTRINIDPDCPHHKNDCICSYKSGGMVYNKNCPQHAGKNITDE